MQGRSQEPASSRGGSSGTITCCINLSFPRAAPGILHITNTAGGRLSLPAPDPPGPPPSNNPCPVSDVALLGQPPSVPQAPEAEQGPRAAKPDTMEDDGTRTHTTVHSPAAISACFLTPGPGFYPGRFHSTTSDLGTRPKSPKPTAVTPLPCRQDGRGALRGDMGQCCGDTRALSLMR